MDLFLHAGAHAATLDEIRLVPTPDATETYQPVPHVTVIEQAKAALERRGIAVKNEQYGLWGDGARLFGVMELEGFDGIHGDFALQFGIRNSHDKRFPAAGLLGSRVFVCDNLAFSGEIQFARKHTTHILRDLPHRVDAAVERLIAHRGQQEKRIETYRLAEITDEQAHDFMIRTVDEGVLPPTKLKQLISEWQKPTFAPFEARTVWSLFNDYTHVLRDSASQLASRTVRLHGLADGLASRVTGQEL